MTEGCVVVGMYESALIEDCSLYKQSSMAAVAPAPVPEITPDSGVDYAVQPFEGVGISEYDLAQAATVNSSV